MAATGALGFRFMKPAVAPPTKPDVPTEKILIQRFEQQIWPLLTRDGKNSCVSCHDNENKSELQFFADAESNFKMLLEQGYFAANNPDALLGRITTVNRKKRMPKGKEAKPWSKEAVHTLRTFLGDLQGYLKTASQADEQFPGALLSRYQGMVRHDLDNQFMSYRQLRGKISTIFQDDWVRNDRDLFEQNLALFGGADFKERFNETSKASATFLTGLEMLSRDVAARAYTRRTGPFAGRAEILRLPLSMAGPDVVYQNEINRLYQTILFRTPTSEETKQAFALLQNVYRAEQEIQSGDYDLAFKLTVQDESTSLKAASTITIPVSGDSHGLYQEMIDQSAVTAATEEEPAEDANKRKKDRKVSGKIARHKLERTFLFKPNDPGQLFKISNINTVGNVSFVSIEIQPAADPATNRIQRILVTDPSVQAEGGWKIEERKGLTSFEDENNDKGNSSITIPITVSADGEYEVTVCWRQNADNATGVLTELFSHNGDRLSKPVVNSVPPRGEAHFFIDESVDTIAFADLRVSFQFGKDDYVEINNKGTRNRVTADAVKFVDDTTKATILVDNDEADGRENWKEFNAESFAAYNKTGKNTYFDDNSRKGELFLRYKPSIKTNAWREDGFYQVQVGYPAKKDHEIRTPIIVKARKSSPIIQIASPARVRVDAMMEIDAAATYAVHGGNLKFKWEQLDGPVVKAEKWDSPVLKFKVPRQSAQQLAWEGLTRALMRHPDFLFTRPPSIEHSQDRREKRRLQLVKIALDLVGRVPTKAELDKLAQGAAMDRMIDEYLQSQEFKDFYFHRIRLYLESHGTELQDEPARLWCYVVFNDRPFQEILTARYTVDSNFQKQPRPLHHGNTGVLTTRGFMEGKPGLPHFNYAAQVAELFLGYVFEVPPEVVAQREGITAVATTDPNSLCYSCHKVLTPLAFQRNRWDDDGRYRAHDDYGMPIDDSDQKLVASYPFKGDGLEAFALQAVKKERFIRTIINTHFTFYFGRELRYQEDERLFYKRLWDSAQANNFAIRGLIKTILTSPEYLEGRPLIRAHDRLTKKNRVDQKETAATGGSLSATVNPQLSAKR